MGSKWSGKWGETKTQTGFAITPTAFEYLDKLAKSMDMNRSEVIERIIRFTYRLPETHLNWLSKPLPPSRNVFHRHREEPKSRSVGVRLTPTALEFLKKLAKDRNLSPTEIIERIIRFIYGQPDSDSIIKWLTDDESMFLLSQDELTTGEMYEPISGEFSMPKYTELLLAFPPIPIRNESQLHATMKVINSLSSKERLSQEEKDYLAVIECLVYDYEDTLGFLGFPDIYGGEMLRVLMNRKDVKQKDLIAAGIFKHQSGVSAVLTGNRKLTADEIQALSLFFKVSPAVFFPNWKSPHL